MMIELPEAVTLARQISEEVKGKRIRSGLRGNSPHKFAFYSDSSDAYAEKLRGKTVGTASEHGNAILIELAPGLQLVLGGGGERILFHQTPDTLPKKHQLLLRFEDDTYLTVSVQGWGNVLLGEPAELAKHTHVGEPRISPLADEFDLEHFLGFWEALEGHDRGSVKHFIISEPGVWGVGNGYLQDILFEAKIHPRMRAVQLNADQRATLHGAIRCTLFRALDLQGRDTERDLYGRPGNYRPILDRRSVGAPCPECRARIEKSRYLGGAVYYCPNCQSLPT